MSGVVEFVQVRGEYVSFFLVLAMLWASGGTIARLVGLPRRAVGDLTFNGAVAFVAVGRLGYLATEAPRSLLDPLVVIRFQAGIEPLVGAAAVAAVAAWQTRGQDAVARWGVAGAASIGLAVATVGYDVTCVVRDACYGAAAPAPFGFEMSGLSEPRIATPLVEATLLMAAGAVLLRIGGRLTVATAALLLGTLALTRAALTPASALGVEAVGLETVVLVVVGILAVGWAIVLGGRGTAAVDGSAG
ncbi:MAG: hypothetical protein R3B59_02670 [Dehalococcoidia bacterium]